MIVQSTDRVHGKTINALSDANKLSVAMIYTGPGKELVLCNSTLAACDWLKANGFYKDGAPSYRIV